MNMNIIKNIEILIAIIINIAYLTLAERKVLGHIQRRKGPNIVGIYGLLQPITDGIKLVIKECVIPEKSNNIYYIMAPLLTLIISLILWAVIPFNIGIIIYDYNLSILYIFAISTLGIYGVLYSGWSSNSKYAFIGGIRGTSQLISYEISIGIILLSIISLNSSFNLFEIFYSQIYIYNIIPLYPIYILLFITALAETNRTPFDLLEAESELVAGFLVEYSSIIFAAFYLGEYCIIIFLSTLISILFFGNLGVTIYTLLIIFKFIWVRATLPRLRYDQLIYLGWTKILPISIAYFLFIFSLLFLFDLT